MIAGTESIEALEGLKAYPNPASGIITFEITGQFDEHGSLYICNSLGQTVKIIGMKKSITIDATELNDGIYFYKLVSEGHERSGKFSVVTGQ
jgi:hypothetical protein